MTDKAERAEGAKAKGAVGELVEIVKTIVYALAIALVLRVIFFQPFTIPSGSMEPTLLQGDYIITSKYSYGWSRHSIPLSPPLFQGRIFERQPQRGDIIVFKLPADTHKDFIKRLVGLPGDRIQVTGGVLSVNGVPVPRKLLGPALPDGGDGYRIGAERYLETFPSGREFVTYDFGTGMELDDTPVFVVPEGHYFFMGDSRDNSSDSRDPNGGVGFVPAENLIGKAQIILLSWHPQASLFKPWTWVMDARPSRFFRPLK